MKYFFALLALAASAWAGAQSLPQQAAQAVRPEAATPAVRYTPMAPAGLSGLVTEGGDWKAANATVGQFPRGHMDIVRWEKAQGAHPAPAPAPSEPLR